MPYTKYSNLKHFLFSALLQSGRVILVVTMCDGLYQREGASSCKEERKRIIDLVCSTYEKALGVSVPRENVIPTSGQWQSWAMRYQTLDQRTRKRADRDADDYIELMDDGEKVVDKCEALKHGSNFKSLEERYTNIIGVLLYCTCCAPNMHVELRKWHTIAYRISWHR